MRSVRPGAGRTALALGALLVAMVSFQASASIATGLFGKVGPEGAAALRLAFGAPLLAAALRPWRARPTRAEWRAIGLYGASLGLMNLLFYMSLASVPLGLAVAIEFTGPLAVAMAGSRRPLDFVWIALCAIGLVLIVRPSLSGGAQLAPGGIACALGAGACWALYIVFGQKAGGAHGLMATGLGMSIAAALIIPIGVLHSGRALLSPGVLALGAVVGVLGTAFPYVLEMAALTRLPARVYGIISSLAPAVGGLAGLVLLGQALSATQWLAIGAVVAASIGATATLRRPALTPLEA